MKMRLSNGTSGNRSLLAFFSIVLVFSIPFWVIGPIVEQALPGGLPVDLPISSLMALAPIAAAVVLVHREKGPAAAKTLLKRAFDYKGIKKKAWYIPVLLFWPALMILQYGLLNLVSGPLPGPQVPVLIVAGSFVVFFIEALCEEVGWQGYAIDPLQERWHALTASVMLGTVWAAWHVVPLMEMGRSPTQIAWQCLGMVATRILIVWLCNNTGRSVLVAILFHAMNNLTTVLLASYGWPYEPLGALVLLALAVAAVIFLWGPETLARYRYAQPDRNVQPSIAN